MIFIHFMCVRWVCVRVCFCSRCLCQFYSFVGPSNLMEFMLCVNKNIRGRLPLCHPAGPIRPIRLSLSLSAISNKLYFKANPPSGTFFVFHIYSVLYASLYVRQVKWWKRKYVEFTFFFKMEKRNECK